MYWIVFALFTTLETFLDIFFSWFPFYYEIKILFILWVLSPATRGSSLLYKKVVHPMLTSREKEIDDLIEKTKSQGYNTFLQLFSSGFQYASNFFLNSAIKGQFLLGNQLKKSLSMNDVYDGGNINGSQSSTNTISDSDMYKMPNTIHEDDEYDGTTNK
jgi:receptor expression-enhancing protein 1/2/3/4